ncbi:hypothetical protein [Salinivibrio socompensis]|uniref:hypothetical protein n=1 Tax=Salinivibrio socompensis TaxID=1510206 RepID=UPI001F0A5919|nr:hypothetical protein [Salinivibrio socompensis]
MSTAEWWEFLIAIPALIFSSYFLLWAVPAVFILAALALGDIKRIEFIDQQLAKDNEKLHSTLRYQFSYTIVNRFMCYCFAYPLIRYRERTNSYKFKIFMWLNCFGFWSFSLGILFLYLSDTLGIIN